MVMSSKRKSITPRKSPKSDAHGENALKTEIQSRIRNTRSDPNAFLSWYRSLRNPRKILYVTSILLAAAVLSHSVVRDGAKVATVAVGATMRRLPGTAMMSKVKGLLSYVKDKASALGATRDLIVTLSSLEHTGYRDYGSEGHTLARRFAAYAHQYPSIAVESLRTNTTRQNLAARNTSTFDPSKYASETEIARDWLPLFFRAFREYAKTPGNMNHVNDPAAHAIHDATRKIFMTYEKHVKLFRQFQWRGRDA